MATGALNYVTFCMFNFFFASQLRGVAIRRARDRRCAMRAMLSFGDCDYGYGGSQEHRACKHVNLLRVAVCKLFIR